MVSCDNAQNALLRNLHQQRVARGRVWVSKSIDEQWRDVKKRRSLEWRKNRPKVRKTLIDLVNDEKEVKVNYGYRSKLGNDSQSKIRTIASLVSNVDLGKECLQYTNEFRVKKGKAKLLWSQALSNIAQEHAKDMAEGKVPLGHSGFKERCRKYPFTSKSAAENVAYCQGFGNDAARQHVNGWIKSPGHRKNLLSNHNYCGIGVWKSGGKCYSCQLFALV